MNNPEDLSVDKYHVATNLLMQGAILVTFDASQTFAAGQAMVPPPFHTNKNLTLRFSFDFSEDLELDWLGISQTLSFGSIDHSCFVPWEAIYRIAPDNNPEEANIWPVPTNTEFSDFFSEFTKSLGQTNDPIVGEWLGAQGNYPGIERSASHLKLVVSQEPEEITPPRGQLRLIKNSKD